MAVLVVARLLEAAAVCCLLTMTLAPRRPAYHSAVLSGRRLGQRSRWSSSTCSSTALVTGTSLSDTSIPRTFSRKSVNFSGLLLWTSSPMTCTINIT